MEEVRPTWKLAWGLLWRILLIALAIGIVIVLILFVAGISLIPWDSILGAL
jgi:hypothetical protein